MMVPALFPWSVVVPALLVAYGRRALTKAAVLSSLSDPLVWFGLCWTFSCPVLLLGAEQYTATYLMPSIPGFALLVAALWKKSSEANWLSDATIIKIVRGSTVLMGVTLLTGALISFWYEANLLFSISATIMALTISALLVANWRSHYSKSQALASASPNLRSQLLVSIINLALLTTFTYGAAVLCYNEHLSNNRSSRRILALIQRDFIKDSPVTVGFPYYFPFSAYFYTTGLTEGKLSIKRLMPDDVATAEADLLVVRKRNLKRLLGDRPNLSEIASLGQWRVLKPTAPPDIALSKAP
jgi:hypothetical protein